jgi:hypothetical protein
MKTSLIKNELLLLLAISFLFICNWAIPVYSMMPQDNPVLAPDVKKAPTIDGIGDDECWQNVPWQNIDEVWIPYGGTVDSNDYSGRYKIVWSSSTNLLYFLMEIKDDIFIDGYVTNVTADIYNFDISEVFIDENTSGGLHIFDGIGSDTLQVGSNAENAFAYHMYAAMPEEGKIITNVYVNDFAGTSWADAKRPDYSSHFPEFALRINDNKAVREFSLKVYYDTYIDSNPEASRVQLHNDKIIGLSVAYCDNDNNDGQRDNMFGSVWEPSPGNFHWMNADYYGRIKLVTEVSTNVENQQPVIVNSVLNVYPNPASSSAQFKINDAYVGNITVRLFNLLGQEVLVKKLFKAGQIMNDKLSFNGFSSGIYFLNIQMGKIVDVSKLIITNR